MMVEALLYTFAAALFGACVYLGLAARRKYRNAELDQQKAEWVYTQSVRAVEQIHSDDVDMILAGLQTLAMLSDYEILVMALARLTELAQSDNVLIKQHAEIAIRKISAPPPVKISARQRL